MQGLAKRRVSYSVGFTLPANMPVLSGLFLKHVWEHVWEAAYSSDGEARERAGTAELAGLLDRGTDWPAGTRVIVRRACPHPGAQLRFDDVDGYRLTAFAPHATGDEPVQLLDDPRCAHSATTRRAPALDTGVKMD